MRDLQLKMLEKQPKAYGGELLKTRRGRSQGRPLDTRNSMHLVLRSSKATGRWSFRNPKNERTVRNLSEKFAVKNGIKIYSLANVGNHLHFHIKLSNRFAYKRFIQGITASIAMAVTGKSRWSSTDSATKLKFWDYRPFTRVVHGFKAFLNMRDYIRVNQLEGFGCQRREARMVLTQRQFAEDSG